MGRKPTLSAVFERYRGRMRRVIYEARGYVRGETVWIDKGETKIRLTCDPIITMDPSGEGELRFTFVVRRRPTAAEKRANAGMPKGPVEYEDDDLDVSFGVISSKEADGTPGGMAFSCEFCTIGGSPCGGMTPYNFTKDVWVPIADAAAIDERFQLFENLGGAEMGAGIVAAWQQHHP